MRAKNLLKIWSLVITLAFSHAASAQQTNDTTRFKTVSAGPQYDRSGFYQLFWGRNHRKEWTQPVTLPVIYLDTLRGGLISYKEGGSNQSKSLHLKTKGGQYALRSVDKTLDKVIPDIFANTFVTDIVNDAISMAHPYGALGVPGIAKAAGIYHTTPKYYYLPAQKALDTLNDKYAGKVYLLEERPKDDWSKADNLGNFEDFESLEDFLPKLLKDSKFEVDQKEFIRARLVDFLINDFDRHADQWKWGVRKENGKNIFVPVPTDRDQAFNTHNGLFLDLVIRVAGLKFIQKYEREVDNVKAMAQINRLIDRLATNETTLGDWQSIAKDVQLRLTDAVIDSSIKAMPPEIYAIRGQEYADKLKSRRNHLVENATDYYRLLAEEPEVVGTEKDEFFEVNNVAGSNTEVRVYEMKNGVKSNTPHYVRTFLEAETDEIRIYGIGGNDVYQVNGKLNKKIDLRIIGGPGRDSVIDNSASNGNRRVHIYDNADNSFPEPSRRMKLHLSEDSAVHVYDYNSFLPDKKGLIPHLGYNDDDRIFVGARYRVLNNKWRKRPFAYSQSLDVDYSITQKAFSTTYNGLFPSLFGKWDLITRANYDFVRWINFHGLGNESVNLTNNRDFYRMRFEDASANLGVGLLTKRSKIGITGFYNMVKIINDTARYVSKFVSGSVPGIFTADNFAGLQVNYDFALVKDSILPDRGITFSLNAKHTQNLEESDRSFQLYYGNVQFFIPLIKKVSLAVKTGGATISGTPLFYQYPNIGQSYNLRGFRRERFSGKSVAYNNTELRFVTNVRSYLFNGKAGLMAFVDNGRVWMPGEKSDKIHTTYGGGILLAPFNMVSAAITYGVSDELKMLQFRMGVLF